MVHILDSSAPGDLSIIPWFQRNKKKIEDNEENISLFGPTSEGVGVGQGAPKSPNRPISLPN